MSGVLDGIRVAAFTHFAAGPLTVQFLGALGADVIKVEAPFGDFNRFGIKDPNGKFGGHSPYFITLNRNQRAISINLKSDEGKEIARKLVASSDVFVENFKPGALKRLGLSYEDVKAFKEDIIYCSISGYDQKGPKANELGQDLLIQAVSGVASLNGFDGTPPFPAGTYPVDAYTSFCCVIGILSALRHRDATGIGQEVRVDMMSAALHMIAQEASYVMNLDPDVGRAKVGVVHPNQAAPYGIYEASGAYFVMSLTPPETLAKLADKLGCLAEIQQFLSVEGVKYHRDEVAGALCKAFKPMQRADAMQVCEEFGIWVAPVNSVGEALQDPSVIAADIVRERDSDYVGKHKVVIEPLKMSETPITYSRTAPKLGEHTSEVLADLGYDDAAIEKLESDGVIKNAD